MANDNLNTTIVIDLNASQAYRDAEALSKRLNRLLSKDIENKGLADMQTELRKSQKDVDDLFNTIRKKASVKIPTDQYTELQQQLKAAQAEQIRLANARDRAEKDYKTYSAKEGKQAAAAAERHFADFFTFDEQLTKQNQLVEQINIQIAELTKNGGHLKEVFDLSKVDKELARLEDRLSGIESKADALEVAAKNMGISFEEVGNATDLDSNGFVNTVAEVDSETEKLTDNLEQTTEALGSANEGAEELKTTVAETDTEKLKSDLKDMGIEVQKGTESLEEMSSASSKLNLNANVSKMEYADLVQYIDRLKAKLTEIRKNGIPDAQKEEFTKITNKLVEAEQAAKNYVKSLKDAKATKLPPINLNADVAKMNIAELVRYMQQLKTTIKDIENAGMPVSRGAEYEQATNQLIRTQKAISDYKRNLDKTAESSQRASRSTISFRNVLSTIRGIGAKAISSVRNGFSTLEKTINKVKSAFNKLSNQMHRDMKHRFTNLVKYVLGFRSLFFLVRRMRKQIKEGLENLARYDDKVSKGVKSHNLFNDAMNELMKSLNYLKNAWAAAFSPIVIYVMPVLTSLIDKLAEVGNYVAYFIASLTGQATAYNALKSAVDDYADSLDKSGSSAKKNSDKQDDLNEKLAEYDKLLVIKQDKDKDNTNPTGGSGSNNKTAEDFNKMFKTITADDSLAKALKSALDDNDFAEFGKLIGEKIRDGLNSINWEDIKKKIGEVGDKIGKFIKGLFSTEGLAGSIGHAAGEVVNSISTFINSILTQTKDVDFGKGLAKVIEAFIDSTDWNLIKTNIREALGQVRDNIKSAIDNFPWAKAQYELKGLATTISSALTKALSDEEFMSSIGTGIGNAVNTFIVALQGIVTGAKGNSVGKGLATALNKGIDTIQWSALGKTLGDGIAYIFNNVADFLDEVNSKNIGDAIFKFLSNIDWKSVFTAVARAAVSAGDAIVNIFNAIGEGVSDGLMSIKPEDLEDAIERLLSQLTPEKVADNVGKIVVAIIKSVLATANVIAAVIAALIKVIGTALGEMAYKAQEEGMSFGEYIRKKLEEEGKEANFQNIGEEIINGLLGGMFGAIDNINNWLVKNIFQPIADAFTSWFEIGSPSKKAEYWGEMIVDGFKNGLSGFWGKIKSIFDPNNNESIFGKIKGVFSAKNFEKIKSALITAWSTVTGIFSDTWKNIKSTFEVSNPDSVWAKLKGKFEASYFKQHIVPTLSKGWETITNVFTNTWKTIGNTFAVSNKDSIWAKLKGKFDASYFKQNIVPTLSKGWETVTGIFTGTWESIKGAFEGKGSFIENIKNKFNSIFKIGSYSGVRKDENLTLFEKLFGYTVGSKHIEGTFDKFKNIFTDTFESIKKGIKTPIGKIIDMVGGLVNSVIDGINTMCRDLVDVKLPGGKYLFPGTYKPIGKWDVDAFKQKYGLAQGAVIPPNKEFLAILGDQKQGVNIETPLDTMVEAFEKALDSKGGSINHDPIVLQLNSRVVAQAVWDEETKKYKQTGFGLAY